MFIFSIAISLLCQKLESSEAKSQRSLFLVNGSVFDSCQCPSDLQGSTLKSNNSGHTSEVFHITVLSVRVLIRWSRRENACMTLLGFWAAGTDGA